MFHVCHVTCHVISYYMSHHISCTWHMSEKESCRRGFTATSLISNLGHLYHVMVVLSNDICPSCKRYSWNTWHSTCHVTWYVLCNVLCSTTERMCWKVSEAVKYLSNFANKLLWNKRDSLKRLCLCLYVFMDFLS